ncbi:MAG TPA: hypothetical protein PLP21_15670 [Pyrinomonadaceae bacterium]|nr:hypothetical protein [Acidobacteriota bacterium]HQZ97760.1 hypothetical protein [Pyrinomonadaceae bacterium]
MKNYIRTICVLMLLGIMPSISSAQSSGAIREAFYNEVGHDVVGYVAVFMNFYDPNLTGNVNINNPGSAAEWTDLMARLARLDNLCKTKYSNVTNDPNFPPNFINGKPKLWCAIAANRVEYERQARGSANDQRAESFVKIWRYDIEKAVNDQKGYVYDDIQRMLYAPTWKTEKFAEVQKAYSSEGLGQPSMKMFDAIEPDLAKVRARIDRDSKTNVWVQPPNSEPAMESFFKTRLLAHPQHRGTEILKIGSNYSNWRVFKNSLGIPTSQYKRGLFLAKRPGQNGLCQIREWIVKQEYIGGGKFGPSKIESFGGAGIYAKCQ